MVKYTVKYLRTPADKTHTVFLELTNEENGLENMESITVKYSEELSIEELAVKLFKGLKK